jgi:predicted  nucleic acid-binding Zn-ribbon protein
MSKRMDRIDSFEQDIQKIEAEKESYMQRIAELEKELAEAIDHYEGISDEYENENAALKEKVKTERNAGMERAAEIAKAVTSPYSDAS